MARVAPPGISSPTLDVTTPTTPPPSVARILDALGHVQPPLSDLVAVDPARLRHLGSLWLAPDAFIKSLQGDTNIRLDGKEMLRMGLTKLPWPNIISAKGANFYGSIFSGVKFRGSFDFSQANLGQAFFTGSNFPGGASFANADLTEAKFNGASLPNANFTRSNLTDAYFSDSGLSSISGSTNGQRTVLPGAIFDGTNLTKTNFRGANLAGARFTACTGYDVRPNNFLYPSVDGFHQLLTPGQAMETYGTNLRGANLRGAVFHRQNMGFFDLAGADIRGANLSGAHGIVRDTRGVKYSASTIFPLGFIPPKHWELLSD